MLRVQEMVFSREKPPPSTLEPSCFVGKNAMVCWWLLIKLHLTKISAQDDPLSPFTQASREIAHPGKPLLQPQTLYTYSEDKSMSHTATISQCLQRLCFLTEHWKQCNDYQLMNRTQIMVHSHNDSH